MKKVNTFIGSPIERIEDFRFLTGRGQYVGDLNDRDLLHAVILRSSVAHGILRRIDASAARKVPGVHAVICGSDIATIPTIPLRQDRVASLVRYTQPVIARDRVRYVGEPMAVVVADSPAIAEDALESIVVEIEPLRAIADRETALKDDIILFEDAGTNVAGRITAILGDADRAFSGASYRRCEQFRIQRHAAVPIEPRGLLATWDREGQILTVFGGAKVPFSNRRFLARMLDLSESAVRVLECDVGGGFGARGEFYPEDFLIPYAARALNRPIKWTEDRRENLMAMNHARDAFCDLEIACTRDGVIIGLRGHAVTDLGAYVRTVGATASRNISQIMSGPYRIPHIRMDVTMVLTNKTPSGTYRGPGRFESDFCRERLLDMVAADLNIDRVELRRRNLIAEADMPYPLATVQELDLSSQCDSGDYQATLDRCLAEINWPERSQKQGKQSNGWYYGLGIGCYIEGGASGPKENARMKIEEDGSISVFVGSSSVGQGVETILSQIAADALGVSMDKIRNVYHGSTDYLEEGFGSYSSRTVVMGGSAVIDAASRLKALVFNAAAKRMNCQISEIAVSDEKVMGPSAVMQLSEFAGLAADGSFASNKRTYAYGAHAAYVAVDPKTGAVSVLDYVAVEDVGRIINPLTLHGQCVGAVVQGLGGVFLEHFVYDKNAQLLTGSFADYLLPTASDFPNVRTVALELKPSPNNPLGAKGAGEGGIIPVGGVIANAVAAALGSFGVQPRELPLTPPLIWQMVQSGRAK